jgi:hypothetical protein
MQKKQEKTALRSPSRRKVSPDSKSGLIAAEKKAEQSAGTECVLDNRSHRTAEDPMLKGGHPFQYALFCFPLFTPKNRC